MSKVTTEHISLMEHTIKGPDRNWFGTDKGCRDANKFDELVKMGYATAELRMSWMCDDVIYRLTKKGKDFLK